MKIKHLIMVSLILAVLTIGAVSASGDIDELAVDDEDTESLDLAVKETDSLSKVDESQNLAESTNEIDMKLGNVSENVEPEKTEPDFDVSIENDEVYKGQQINIAVVTNSEIINDIKIKENNNYRSFFEGDKVTFTFGNLDEGEYNYTVYFNGNDKFKDMSKVVSFKVLPKLLLDVSIKVDDFYFGQNGVAYIVFNDTVTEKGLVKTSANTYSIFFLNGAGRMTLTNLNVGKQTIYVILNQSVKFAPVTASATFKVLPSLAKIVVKDYQTYYTSGYFSAKVYGFDGKPLKGKKVTFKFNGEEITEITTNNKGIAKFKVFQAPGTYMITVEALGKTVTKKLTVKHIVSLKAVKVKKSGKKLVLTSTVKIAGKAVANKKIKFKFNGKGYTAKTDKKGVAKVVIAKKILKKLRVGKKVTYQATYLKDTVKYTVKVKR